MKKNVCAVLAFIIAIVGMICACVVRIKYYEYSSLYITLHHFSELLPSYICVITSAVLLKLSS